jgi:hypothetical protein
VLILTLIVATLAVARLARLVAEDEIMVGFRRWVINRNGTNGWLTKLVHCAPWCMSFWFALIMPVAVYFPSLLLIAILSPFAGSMAAAVILRIADGKDA